MQKSKAILPLTALLVFVLYTAIALAESTLAGLWQSGCDFLFHTDNVTVKGEAAFSLDGEHFKTAKLNYVQDGFRSYYGLTLLTPKADGTERETGWTIIADEEGYYAVMEAYFPSTYRLGSGAPQNSLLRRTVQLDALTELGGLVVGQIEPLLPDGVITETAGDNGKTVHIALAPGQVPDMAAGALNLAANYLADRWFNYGIEHIASEETCASFDVYVTPTQALADGTVRWTLKSADIDFSLDAQGRLTGVKGTVRATSTFWDQTEREVEVAFDLAVTDYGESHVKPFDPDDYHVVYHEYPYVEDEDYNPVPAGSEEMDALMDKVNALFQSQGFSIDPNAKRDGWNMGSYIDLSFTRPDVVEYYCAFAEDGSVLRMQAYWDEWGFADGLEPEGVDEKTVAAAKDLIHAFIAENNPALSGDIKDLMVLYMFKTQDGSLFLSFSDAGQAAAYFVVQIEPVMRIVSYSQTNYE